MIRAIQSMTVGELMLIGLVCLGLQLLGIHLVHKRGRRSGQ